MTAQHAPLQERDRLALLYRVSQAFNSSLDLDQVLNTVIDEVIAVTGAERGFVMLKDRAEDLIFHAARGLDRSTVERPEFQVSRGVIERVARDGQPVLTSNAQSDQWLSERQSVVILGLRSVLCVPLRHKDKALLGVIYVDSRVQAGIFNSADLELLTAIASSAAAAIDNARLYQVAVEKGRMERELQLALRVQSSLLPSTTPHLPGWEFAAYWQPAREVAGDFYDFISLPGDRLGVVIADVSDKGMPAALYMAVTRSVARASLLHAVSPAEGVARTNQSICADARGGTFVTLFYAELDPLSGEMRYVNAGHNPPIHYQAAQKRWEKLSRTGMALGVEETTLYEQRSCRLEMGDFVLLYTDGVTEAMDPAGEEFGQARLNSILEASFQATALGLVQAIQKAVEEFGEGEALFDDLTLVVMKRCCE